MSYGNREVTIININKCIKTAKKLKLFPDGVYTPQRVEAVWNAFISDRSSGKTTAWLIVGLIAYVEDGTITHYVRSKEQMIRESNINKIYSVIESCGYISKITNDKYNSIEYRRNVRGFYLAYKDSEGNTIASDTECCCKVLSIDNNDNYKSSYQCDKADYVIFDEFINAYYKSGEFVIFCDLLSTLFRKRLTGYIIMLANTINRRSEYFDELGCRDFIETAEQGDKITYELNGTSVHVEIVGTKLDDRRKLFNSRYFNFSNLRLNSITGAGWSIDNVPHITKKADSILVKNVFVHYQTNYVQLYIVKVNEYGLCIHAVKSNAPKKEDCIIYSVSDDFSDKKYIYSKGNDRFSKWLWGYMYDSKKWFFATNSVGSIIKAYYSTK